MDEADLYSFFLQFIIIDVDNDIEEDDFSKEVDGDYIEEDEESYDANNLEAGQSNMEVEIIH